MSNLNKKLLESLDNLDSYILNEARDDKLHVTVITGDGNEDFIKANRRKIVDVYTDGPEGYFFTKGVPSGGYEYDDNDGYLTGELDLDADQLYLPDGSINKDYIINALDLTEWDGEYYGADGRNRYFTWGEMSDEEKAAKQAAKEERAKEKEKDQLAKKLLVDFSDKIKAFAEDKLDVELDYSIAHGYPVYFKKGRKSRLFSVRRPAPDRDKLSTQYDEVLNKAYEDAVYELCHEDDEFRNAFNKKADKDIKKDGSVSNRVDFNGEVVKLEEVIKAIPTHIKGGELLKDPNKEINIIVDSSKAEQSFKRDSVYKLIIKSDLRKSDVSDEYKWRADELVKSLSVCIGPYSHSFDAGLTIYEPIIADAVIKALEAYGLKQGHPEYNEKHTIDYMKKTGQLK